MNPKFEDNKNYAIVEAIEPHLKIAYPKPFQLEISKARGLQRKGILKILCNKNIVIQNDTVGDVIPWSDGLLRYIDRCSYKYIIYTMEDFFWTGKWNIDKILSYKHYLETKNCAMIKFYNNSNIKKALIRNPEKIEDNLFVYPNDFADLCSCLPSLWEKETLKKYLYPEENGRQFEARGDLRMREDNARIFFNNDFSIAPHKETIVQGKIRPKTERYFNI